MVKSLAIVGRMCSLVDSKRRGETGRQFGAPRSFRISFLTGRAGMLPIITKPRRWRGGAQIIEDVSEDAQPLKRAKVKRQDWREQWQVDTPEPVMDDKP